MRYLLALLLLIAPALAQDRLSVIANLTDRGGNRLEVSRATTGHLALQLRSAGSSVPTLLVIPRADAKKLMGMLVKAQSALPTAGRDAMHFGEVRCANSVGQVVVSRGEVVLMVREGQLSHGLLLGGDLLDQLIEVLLHAAG